MELTNIKVNEDVSDRAFEPIAPAQYDVRMIDENPVAPPAPAGK